MHDGVMGIGVASALCRDHRSARLDNIHILNCTSTLRIRRAYIWPSEICSWVNCASNQREPESLAKWASQLTNHNANDEMVRSWINIIQFQFHGAVEMSFSPSFGVEQITYMYIRYVLYLINQSVNCLFTKQLIYFNSQTYLTRSRHEFSVFRSRETMNRKSRNVCFHCFGETMQQMSMKQSKKKKTDRKRCALSFIFFFYFDRTISFDAM